MTTFYDRVLQETHDVRAYDSFREPLLRAKKFVVDERMSSFMTDLAEASFRNIMEEFPKSAETTGLTQEILENKRQRMVALLNGGRKLARLPFPVTWVEFDGNARSRRWNEAYKGWGGSEQEATVKDTPRPCGWLMIERGVGVVGVTFMCMHSDADKVGIAPYEFRYSTDDFTVPSGKCVLEAIFGKGRFTRDQYESSIETMTTGIRGSYCDQVRVVENNLTKYLTVERFSAYVRDLRGELRYVFTLLSTINDVPVGIAEVQNSHGYKPRSSKWKPFMRHSNVTIDIPKKKDVKRLARRVVALSRMGRHEVRGHWRRYGQAKIRKWVENFLRGDETLGWVGKTYQVKRSP